jgi:5-methylcytosine-specific restriction endonuclease McrA
VKTCPACKEAKPSDAFGADRSRPDGKQSRCKTCKNEATRRWQKANPEEARAAVRRWQKTNHEKYRQITHNVRARKRGAVGSHSLTEWKALLESTGYLCSYCRWPLSTDRPVPAGKRRATRDHIVPCVLGGSNGIENIAPACLPCNRRKGDRTVEELLASCPLPLSPLNPPPLPCIPAG